MKWVLSFLFLLTLLIGAVLIAGYSLPAKTTVSRSIFVEAQPDKVFALLSDATKLPEWDRKIEKVTILPAVNGHAASRQTFANGMTMTIVTSESMPPRHLTRAIEEDYGPFIGSWTYDITPQGQGSRVVLTEQADWRNPVFRLVVRIRGRTRDLDEHLKDLVMGLQENPTKS
jgi:uncharacterized protein YndB with AHSA1/START domain